MKGYCSFPDKQALSGLIDKTRVSVYEQGTQGPGIPRCGSVSIWAHDYRLCTDFQMPSPLLHWLRSYYVLEWSLMQNFPLSPTFLQRSHSNCLYSFILIADTQGAKTHFQQYRMSIHLVWGNVSLFFRTTKLFLLFFIKLNPSKN